MLTSTICLTLLAYQATKIDGVNVYALSTIGYLVYSLGQVFHFCIFGNRLIEEVCFDCCFCWCCCCHFHVNWIKQKEVQLNLISVNSIRFSSSFSLYSVEFIGNGGGLLLPLVWWFWRGKNIRSDCVPTMSKGYDHFGSEILHCVIGSVRFGMFLNFLIVFLCFVLLGKFSEQKNNNNYKYNYACQIGAWCCCNLLHGVGATQIKNFNQHCHQQPHQREKKKYQNYGFDFKMEFNIFLLL